MIRTALLTALGLWVLASTPALSCTYGIATDPVTGEAYSSNSPGGLRREQAGWRAEADLIFIAQIREARMVAGGEIDFRLVPIATVDGERPPDGALLAYRWHPGNTCNLFRLNLTDLVVVYAKVEEPLGWSVVGLTVPDQFQEPPADFRRRLREVYRGMIEGPALPQ